MRAGGFVVVPAVVAAGCALWLAVRLLEPLLTFFPVRELSVAPDVFGLPWEEMRARTADGLDLRGWFVPAAITEGSRRPLTIVVFHGNAENIASGIDLAARAHRAGFAVALAEYRGYARNPGSPSEKGLGLDGDAWARAVAARSDVDPARMVLWGRSIGACVAVRLAAEGVGTGLVLESPFTSARDLLRASGNWILYALSFLGSYRFDQAALMGEVRMPLLVIHGTHDEVVPFRLGRRVHDLAAGPKSLLAIEGGGHNDLMARHGDELWAGAERFLRGIAAAQPAG